MIRKNVYIIILCLMASFISADNQLAIAYYKAGQPSVAKRLLEQRIKEENSTSSKTSSLELAEAYYYLGEIAFDAGRFPEAQTYYQQGWDSSHAYPFNKVGEGNLLLTTDKAAAENAFNEALKIDKKNAALFTAIATAYQKAKMESVASSYIEKARKINSTDPAIFIYEGDWLLASNKPGDAAGKYEQAIYFDPNCMEAYLKYANVYQSVTPALAITMLQKVVTSHPDFLLAYNELGNVYTQQGQYTNAINAYKKYIDGNVYSTEDLIHYASALFFNKQYQEAAVIINEGLSSEPDNFLLRRLNMYNAFETKAYEAGIKQAETLFNTPDQKIIWQDYLYYGRLLNVTKQYKQALQNLLQVVSRTNTHNEVYQDIASVYNNLGNSPLAAEMYDKYMTTLDKNKIETSDYFQSGVYNYTAATIDSTNINSRNPYLAKADSMFNLVIERVPNSYLGYLWKARTSSLLDPETEQGLAKPFYDSCLLYLENNKDSHKKELAECYRYLGYYYYIKNDLANSKTYWNKILKIDPTNKVALEAIQDIK